MKRNSFSAIWQQQCFDILISNALITAVRKIENEIDVKVIRKNPIFLILKTKCC